MKRRGLRVCLWIIRALVLLVLAATPVRATETLTFIHNDVAGSPVAATNQAGAVIWREAYRPYGERTRNEAAALSNRQFFHRQAVDPDTGLSYVGARYYDPIVGRFMGVDPQYFNEGNLHSFNRYAYGNNNPYKFEDRDGHLAFLIIPIIAYMASGAVIGGATAAAVNAGMQYYQTGSVQMNGIGGVWDATGDGAMLGAILGAAGGPEAGVAASVSGAARGGVAKNIDPKALIGRQSRDEMTGSKVKRFEKDMNENGYSGYPPIDAANVDGKLIIIDGHHRRQAAVRAGIKEVPVNIMNPTKEQGNQLLREAAETRR